MQPQVEEAGSHQNPEEAKKEFPPKASRGRTALPTA